MTELPLQPGVTRATIGTMTAGHAISEERIAGVAWTLGDSPHVVVAAGPDGRIAWANEAAAKHFERAPAGAVFADLLPSASAEALRAAERALSLGEHARFEWGEESAGRVRCWFHCTLSPLREADGSIVGYLALSADMTEAKRTERRLRRSEQLMVDTHGTAHLGTWEWDVTEPTAVWSDELYRIYGLTKDGYTPSYERYLTMIHPDDRQRVVDATKRVFDEHVPYSHDERIFRPDGTIRYLHTWAHPVLDESGKLTRLVGVCQDITDRAVAEEQVRQLNVELERRVLERTRTIESSLRDLEQLNAMVSHDLRAPLSVIQMTCELIRVSNGGTVPPMLEDCIARIQRSVRHMAALLEDLLTLAQVGSVTLERVDVDVTALAEEILDDLRRGSPERGVETRVAKGLRLSGDATLVRTVFENLLGNAFKYSSRVETARIEVGAHEGGIFVRDNGAGFEMSEAHRLFTPFERLHTASEFEGTGVGLAAVHRIVERHGGRIWAESEPGKGATFFVVFG